MAGAGAAVATKMAEKAPDVVEKVKDQAGEFVNQIKDTVYAAAADEEDEPEMAGNPHEFVYGDESASKEDSTVFPAGEEPRAPLDEENDPLV